MLNLNPELYTIWNYRRDILLNGGFERSERIKLIEFDLKMVMTFLRQYPKCYWVWNHRVWCLYELSESGDANWKFELMMVEKLLDLDARNFHGWQYRRIIVENMEKEAGDTKKESSAQDPLLAITYKEYIYTTSKINKNISNFSAWHNRSKILPKLYKLWQENKSLVAANTYPELTLGFSSPYSILIQDLELIKTGMYMDADDTSIWLYLQWLLSDKLFLDDFKTTGEGKKTYIEILNEQLEIIEELNDLEKDDHPENFDNIWCLKSIIFLKELISKETGKNSENEITTLYERLIELDPIRKGRYLEKIKNQAATEE